MGKGWPKDRPPKTVRAFEQWLDQWAEKNNLPREEIRRGVTTVVMTEILGRVRDEKDIPLVLVKGGTHMLLRYQQKARPTKDFDIALHEGAQELDRTLDEAFRLPCFGFTATLAGRSEPIRDTGSYRATVKVRYQSQPWQTVQLKAATNEAPFGEVDYLPSAPDLTLFGFPQATAVACLPARYQIAQKIHAVTEVWEPGRINDRYRDLIDLQILGADLDSIGLERVGMACIDVFTRRQKHQWPPLVNVYKEWEHAYKELAERVGFPVTDVDKAAANVTTLIKSIDMGIKNTTRADFVLSKLLEKPPQ